MSNSHYGPPPRYLIDTADAEWRWARTLTDAQIEDRAHVERWPAGAILHAFDFGLRALWADDSRFWKNGDYAGGARRRAQLETVLRWGAGALDPIEAERLLEECEGNGGGLYAEDWIAFRDGPQWAALEARADDPWCSANGLPDTLESLAYDRLTAAGLEALAPPQAPDGDGDEVRRWVHFCADHGAALLDDAGQIVGDWCDRALLVLALAGGHLDGADPLPEWLRAAGRAWRIVAEVPAGGVARFAVPAADAAEAAARLRADWPPAAAWTLRITPGPLAPAAEAVTVPAIPGAREGEF